MKITSINDNRSSCFFFSQLEHIKHCTCVYWEIFHTEYYILFSFNEKQQTSKVNVLKETFHFKTNHRRSSVQHHSQCLEGFFAYLECRCCLSSLTSALVLLLKRGELVGLVFWELYDRGISGGYNRVPCSKVKQSISIHCFCSRLHYTFN